MYVIGVPPGEREFPLRGPQESRPQMGEDVEPP